MQVTQSPAIKAQPQVRVSHGLLGSQSCFPHCESDAHGTKTGGALLIPKIMNLRAVLKRGVGLLHHLNFNTEIEDLCETSRCPQTQGQHFSVCALWIGAAVGLDTSPRLHTCMGRGKGGAPRCGSSNSFLPLQNKEGLLIHSTGRSMGGSCSCTHYLQAEVSPDLWCGFVPGALQRAALWREALWAGMQLPVPCGMRATEATRLLGAALPNPLSEQLLLGQGQPQLGPALWQGFAACLPAVLILALMCVTQMESLYLPVGFSLCVPVPDSHAWVLLQPHIPSAVFHLPFLLLSWLLPPSPV